MRSQKGEITVSTNQNSVNKWEAYQEVVNSDTHWEVNRQVCSEVNKQVYHIAPEFNPASCWEFKHVVIWIVTWVDISK